MPLLGPVQMQLVSAPFLKFARLSLISRVKLDLPLLRLCFGALRGYHISRHESPQTDLLSKEQRSLLAARPRLI